MRRPDQLLVRNSNGPSLQLGSSGKANARSSARNARRCARTRRRTLKACYENGSNPKRSLVRLSKSNSRKTCFLNRSRNGSNQKQTGSLTPSHSNYLCCRQSGSAYSSGLCARSAKNYSGVQSGVANCHNHSRRAFGRSTRGGSYHNYRNRFHTCDHRMLHKVT